MSALAYYRRTTGRTTTIACCHARTLWRRGLPRCVCIVDWRTAASRTGSHACAWPCPPSSTEQPMILRRSRTPFLLPCVLLPCLLSSCGGEDAADAGTAATPSPAATVTVSAPPAPWRQPLCRRPRQRRAPVPIQHSGAASHPISRCS
ncbi:hypothetical protein XAP412_370068 [Xanthomonas phaseoli pv. phaseoli]|uniref:Secreted protein n=1 Tax=Xanthomonas campestris pv. phaseoli TaxID=317013 RepID=A0ABY1TSZ5_XANCH|nr:hypothetical protein XAP6984_420119 [Xanthomonas phaseoli pv. phaseoli]SON84655.1 hypothetical protein XAP412_370068 [Xanthomonas phaseoli pv. phaseoli]